MSALHRARPVYGHDAKGAAAQPRRGRLEALRAAPPRSSERTLEVGVEETLEVGVEKYIMIWGKCDNGYVAIL